jgi:hypothetical protein
VCHRTVCGAPPDSVRCTRAVRLQTCHLRVSEEPLRYNSPDYPVYHRTVQCTSGATASQCNGRLQRSPATLQCADSSRRSQSSRRRHTGHWIVSVWCGTGLFGATWRQSSNARNRQNPNGWVTWLAHRTVWCAHREQPSPTVELVVGGYKYPTTTSTPIIQAFTIVHSIQEKNTTLQDTNQSLRSNQSPQFNSSILGLVRRSSYVLCYSCCLVGFLLSLILTLKAL